MHAHSKPSLLFVWSLRKLSMTDKARVIPIPPKMPGPRLDWAIAMEIGENHTLCTLQSNMASFIKLVRCLISDALSAGPNSHRVWMSCSTPGEKRLRRSGWTDLSYLCPYPCVPSEQWTHHCWGLSSCRAPGLPGASQ